MEPIPYYLEKITTDNPHSKASVKFESVRLERLNDYLVRKIKTIAGRSSRL